MPFYKDTPENRKLNRVGKFYGPKGPSPIKLKYTKKTTPLVVEEASPPSKLVAIMKQATGSTTPRPIKLARPKTPPRTPRKKKLPMSEGVAKKAPAPKVKKKAKKQKPNILRVIDIELMMEYFKMVEKEGGSEPNWSFDSINDDDFEYQMSMGMLEPFKKGMDEDELPIYTNSFLKKVNRFREILIRKEEKNLKSKDLGPEDRDKLQKAIKENKKK